MIIFDNRILIVRLNLINFWLRRQSQISLFRVARPTLRNRVKLSWRVGKFVGLFVSKMFSLFENCIIVVFCKRFLALSKYFIFVYYYTRHFVSKVTVFKGHNLKPPLMSGGVMFWLADCWTFFRESQNGGRKRKPEIFYDRPTHFSDLARTRNGDICDFRLIFNLIISPV